MDQYQEFCRLRDYRKPGVEVSQHTEAEAFALAIGAFPQSTERVKATSPTSRQLRHSCDRCDSVMAEPSDLYEMPADLSCEACLTDAERR
jgi:hypothetical protein